MKGLLFVFVITGLVFFFGCEKSTPDNMGTVCTSKPPSADSLALLKYAADSSITVTRDSTGMYYQIIDSGNNNKPIFSSNMFVNYTGRLMSGKIFDSASNTNLQGAGLYKLIAGWRIGLPKIGVGGRIKMLIPSAYAWGCTGYLNVPPDAPVYFDVKLLSVN